MDIKPLQFGDEGQVATRELAARFGQLASRLRQAMPSWSGRLDALGRRIGILEVLDRQHGGSGAIEAEETESLAAAVLSGLAGLGADARRLPIEALDREIADLVIATAVWAMRHELRIDALEPVVNALAFRSNTAATAQELAAVFGLMQGVIANVAPLLAPDLERSNPERPWRILHLNFALTAIRTADTRLIDHAFDALDAGLPDERGAFYAEALARALAPGIAPPVRERIAERHLKWTRPVPIGDNQRFPQG